MARNTQGLWLDLCMEGLAADRPNIPVPPPSVFSFYFATDTGDLSLWNPAAQTWSVIGTANSEITQQGAAGLTASTTQTLVGALQLVAKFNTLATVANAGDAVKLPAANPGAQVWLFNNGAHAASVFPQASTDVIDGGSAGAAATVTNAKGAIFVCDATGVWQSFGIATKAA